MYLLAVDFVHNIFFSMGSIAPTSEIMHPKISVTIAIAGLVFFVLTVVHFQPLCTFILTKIILRKDGKHKAYEKASKELL